MLFPNKRETIILSFLISCISLYAQPKNPAGNNYPVVAWYALDSAHNSYYYYKQMKAGGFNLALNAYSTKEETLRELKMARRAGMKLIVDCQEGRNANEGFISNVKNEKALGLYYLKDEPQKQYFDNLNAKTERINRADGSHYGYINLLPIYASTEQLNASSYEDYLDTYLQTVSPQIVSFDHYPFVRDDFREDFYDNLQIVARKCKQYGKVFWGFARTSLAKDYYAIDEGRLRFQVFMTMAFGAQGIQYFTYGPVAGRGTAIVDSLYNKTAIYDIVKNINKEVQVVGKKTLKADFISILTGDNIDGFMETVSCLGDLKFSGEGFVLSFFRKDGREYILAVNRDFEHTQEISLTFSNKVSQLKKLGGWGRRQRQYNIRVMAGDWIMLKLN